MFAGNKKPLLLLLIFSFWVVYSGFTAFQFFSQAKKQTEQLLLSRQANLDFILQSSVGSLLQEHPDGLQDKLAHARRLGLIDFYILQKGPEAVFFENNSGRLSDLNHNYVNFNQLIETDLLKFKTIKILDFRLTAGFSADKNAIIFRTFRNLLPLMLKDIGIVTLLLGLVAFSILKDIINLSKTISSRTRSHLASIKTTSREADTLLKGALSLENETSRLREVSETFGATVGPALRHELNSKKTPPYGFTATLCRVDLNGYTQIFFKNNATYLNQILNEYFARARETIGRYQGLIYQFIGDEIVFEFKDEMAGGATSQGLAVACIRDLFHEAQVLESQLPPTANHYFKLKGSLAYGDMNFVSLDQGHALTGLPLIESVRLLSLIDDRDHQVLSFFGEVSDGAIELCRVTSTQKNQLKGFKEESEICMSREFKTPAEVFANQRWDLLTYFRSDEALSFILTQLREMSEAETEKPEVMSILTEVKHTKTSLIPQPLAECCEKTLAAFIKAEGENRLSAKTLASLVGFIGRIVPQNLLNGELRQLMESLLHHPNFRVQSNAVVALGPQHISTSDLYEKMYSENNRVSADAIIEIAKVQMNEEVLRALHRLLESRDNVYKKSGAYAVHQILGYYAERDPVFLQTNAHLLQIQKLSKDSRVA